MAHNNSTRHRIRTTKIDQYTLEPRQPLAVFFEHITNIPRTQPQRALRICAYATLYVYCGCVCVCAFWKLINVCFCSSYLKRLFWCVSNCECVYEHVLVMSVCTVLRSIVVTAVVQSEKNPLMQSTTTFACL